MLNITTTDGVEYSITHAGHALALSKRMRPGMGLTEEQMTWLENWRMSKPADKRDTLLQRLRDFRVELRSSVLTKAKR